MLPVDVGNNKQALISNYSDASQTLFYALNIIGKRSSVGKSSKAETMFLYMCSFGLTHVPEKLMNRAVHFVDALEGMCDTAGTVSLKEEAWWCVVAGDMRCYIVQNEEGFRLACPWVKDGIVLKKSAVKPLPVVKYPKSEDLDDIEKRRDASIIATQEVNHDIKRDHMELFNKMRVITESMCPKSCIVTTSHTTLTKDDDDDDYIEDQALNQRVALDVLMAEETFYNKRSFKMCTVRIPLPCFEMDLSMFPSEKLQIRRVVHIMQHCLLQDTGFKDFFPYTIASMYYANRHIRDCDEDLQFYDALSNGVHMFEALLITEFWSRLKQVLDLACPIGTVCVSVLDYGKEALSLLGFVSDAWSQEGLSKPLLLALDPLEGVDAHRLTSWAEAARAATLLNAWYKVDVSVKELLRASFFSNARKMPELRSVPDEGLLGVLFLVVGPHHNLFVFMTMFIFVQDDKSNEVLEYWLRHGDKLGTQSPWDFLNIFEHSSVRHCHNCHTELNFTNYNSCNLCNGPLVMCDVCKHLLRGACHVCVNVQRKTEVEKAVEQAVSSVKVELVDAEKAKMRKMVVRNTAKFNELNLEIAKGKQALAEEGKKCAEAIKVADASADEVKELRKQRKALKDASKKDKKQIDSIQGYKLQMEALAKELDESLAAVKAHHLRAEELEKALGTSNAKVLRAEELLQESKEREGRMEADFEAERVCVEQVRKAAGKRAEKLEAELEAACERAEKLEAELKEAGEHTVTLEQHTERGEKERVRLCEESHAFKEMTKKLEVKLAEASAMGANMATSACQTSFEAEMCDEEQCFAPPRMIDAETQTSPQNKKTGVRTRHFENQRHEEEKRILVAEMRLYEAESQSLKGAARDVSAACARLMEVQKSAYYITESITCISDVLAAEECSSSCA